MSFSGDLYSTGGASVVMTTKGDLVRYDSDRERLGIGSANQILQVKSNLPKWETVPLADTVLTTAGDVLYENNTPELARLPKATDGDVLTLASGLPSWSAPAGGGSVEKIASLSQPSGSIYMTLTFTSVPQAGVSYFVGTFSGKKQNTNNCIDLIVNGIGTGTYNYNWRKGDNGSWSEGYSSSASQFRVVDNPSPKDLFIQYYINFNQLTDYMSFYTRSVAYDGGGTDTEYKETWGHNNTASQTALTEIKFHQQNGAGDILTGTVADIYKVNQ